MGERLLIVPHRRENVRPTWPSETDEFVIEKASVAEASSGGELLQVLRPSEHFRLRWKPATTSCENHRNNKLNDQTYAG
jgi:hypothetical protein